MYPLNPLYEFLNKDQKRSLETTGAIGSGLIGANLIKNSTDRLAGTVTRFHNTDKSNVSSIMDKGILAKFADDPENLTNSVLRDVDPSKKTGLVYTSKTRSFANGVGAQRYKINHPFEAMAGVPITPDKTGKNIKLKFRYDDIKKMGKVANPELRGATNPKEFFEKLISAYQNSPGQLNAVKKEYGASSWDKLSPLGKLKAKIAFKGYNDTTHVFRGDIKPEHIVGSKHYKPQTSWSYWKQYVKNNPKRFAKGVAGAGAGVAALGTAGYLGYKAIKKNSEEK